MNREKNRSQLIALTRSGTHQVFRCCSCCLRDRPTLSVEPELKKGTKLINTWGLLSQYMTQLAIRVTIIYTYSCQRRCDIATCCQVSVVVSSAVYKISNASCLIIMIIILMIIIIIIHYLWRPIWQEPGASYMNTLISHTHWHTLTWVARTRWRARAHTHTHTHTLVNTYTHTLWHINGNTCISY